MFQIYGYNPIIPNQVYRQEVDPRHYIFPSRYRLPTNDQVVLEIQNSAERVTRMLGGEIEAKLSSMDAGILERIRKGHPNYLAALETGIPTMSGSRQRIVLGFGYHAQQLQFETSMQYLDAFQDLSSMSLAFQGRLPNAFAIAEMLESADYDNRHISLSEGACMDEVQMVLNHLYEYRPLPEDVECLDDLSEIVLKQLAYNSVNNCMDELRELYQQRVPEHAKMQTLFMAPYARIFPIA